MKLCLFFLVNCPKTYQSWDEKQRINLELPKELSTDLILGVTACCPSSPMIWTDSQNASWVFGVTEHTANVSSALLIVSPLQRLFHCLLYAWYSDCTIRSSAEDWIISLKWSRPNLHWRYSENLGAYSIGVTKCCQMFYANEFSDQRDWTGGANLKEPTVCVVWFTVDVNCYLAKLGTVILYTK